MRPLLLLALLAVALAGTALGVSVTAYVRAQVVRGGRYLVSTTDGRFRELDLAPIEPAAFAARRSVRIDTVTASTTGKFIINMTASLTRSGPFRMLFLSQTSDGPNATNASMPYTVELNTTANGILTEGDLPESNARLLAHTGVIWHQLSQRDLISRFDATTGGVTITAPGPALAVGPYPSVGVFNAWQITSTLRVEGTMWTWHTA